MSNNFMSSLPVFTLESLVTNGQWAAAQSPRRKKLSAPTMRDLKSKPAIAEEQEKSSRTEL